MTKMDVVTIVRHEISSAFNRMASNPITAGSPEAFSALADQLDAEATIADVVDEWLERLITERKEVDERLGKLQAFLDSKLDFDAIPGEPLRAFTAQERDRLVRQRDAMETYRNILAERIAAVGTRSA